MLGHMGQDGMCAPERPVDVSGRVGYRQKAAECSFLAIPFESRCGRNCIRYRAGKGDVADPLLSLPCSASTRFRPYDGVAYNTRGISFRLSLY